jgi:hypothetical protein
MIQDPVMHNINDYRPGVREAHLLRKRDNPLFPPDARAVSNEALAAARLQDGLEMDRFREDFQALVQRAVALEANAPSETILAIKEELDRSYQRACALPGDQSAVKDAIRKLLGVIMRAVAGGIGNDAYAARQLEEETLAREAHFALQELPLVVALTHADSPVAEDELIPSLLSERDAGLEGCLMLFDESQLAAICHDAGRWLQSMDPDRTVADAWRRLAIIQAYYSSLKPHADAN